MPVPTIPDTLLLTLPEVLALLPNVKPRLARQRLVDLREDFLRDFSEALARGEPWAVARGYEQELDEAGQPIPYPPDPSRLEVAPGVVVTSGDVDALFAGVDGDRVTPDGAGLLVRLYEAGVFELQRKRAGLSDPAELRAYAASGPALAERAAEERAAREAVARAYAERVRHPERITEAEFTYRLLNDVFIAQFGLRGGTYSMDIGGVQVTKDVQGYSSNSGKNRDYTVTFTWMLPDGTRRELTKESMYTGNRRNDADRNWGLGPG